MKYKLRQKKKNFSTYCGWTLGWFAILALHSNKTCKDSHHCDVNSISYDLPLRGNTSDTNIRAQSPLVNWCASRFLLESVYYPCCLVSVIDLISRNFTSKFKTKNLPAWILKRTQVVFKTSDNLSHVTQYSSSGLSRDSSHVIASPKE